jgi:hypothetical protein
MEASALFSTAYLPPLGYMARMLQFDHINWEVFENYPKQTYRNRCRIPGPNGIQSLSIPTLKTDELKRLTKEVRIANTDRWQQVHWRSIETAYNKSPYFMYYRDAFEPMYSRPYDFLVDYNLAIMQVVMRMLKVKTSISLTDHFVPIGSIPHDYRDSFTPKQESGIIFPPYYQVFGDRQGFHGDLSIIDLLFNLGPGARQYLETIGC